MDRSIREHGRKHTHAYGMHAAGQGSANFAIAQSANRVSAGAPLRSEP